MVAGVIWGSRSWSRAISSAKLCSAPRRSGADVPQDAIVQAAKAFAEAPLPARGRDSHEGRAQLGQHVQGQTPGAQDVAGGQRQRPQQLRPQQAGEEPGHRRAVVGGGQRHHRAHARRQRFGRDRIGQVDVGGDHQARIQAAAGMPHQVDRSLGPGGVGLQDLVHLHQHVGGPVAQGGRGPRLDGVQAGVDSLLPAPLGQGLPDVGEVGQVSQVIEPEEPGQQEHVVGCGHGRSMPEARGGDVGHVTISLMGADEGGTPCEGLRSERVLNRRRA